MLSLLALLCALDEPKVTLKPAGGKVAVTGTADLPEGALVVFEIGRLEERWLGDRIELVRSSEVIQKYGLMQGRTAKSEMVVAPLSFYVVEMRFDPSVQGDEVAALLGPQASGWAVSAKMWSGAPDGAVAKVRKLATRAQELRARLAALLDRAERIVSSRQTFEREEAALRKEAEDLSLRTLELRREIGLSAAPAMLETTAGDLATYLRGVEFASDGNVKPPVDYHTGKARKTARGKEFSFAQLRSDLADFQRVLRRELWLFVPKAGADLVDCVPADGDPCEEAVRAFLKKPEGAAALEAALRLMR